MIVKKLSLLVLFFTLCSIVLWNTGGESQLDEVSLAEKEIGISLDSQLIEANDIKLHVVFAGPADGEPVILIHGFPQLWYAWRWQIKALAEQGYRVAAVDMRGYNRSDKPKGKDQYDYEDYAADITGLMDSQNWVTANIVGHDIGGAVAWELIFDNANRVNRAIVFSTAHPLAYANTDVESDVSWYRSFFRIPILPELLSRLGSLTFMTNGIRDSSREGTFTAQELDMYKQTWQREHAYYSMLGAYRNNGLDLRYMPKNGQPRMPVKYIGGMLDKYIAAEVAQASQKYLQPGHVRLYSNFTHWLLEEEPEQTSQDILEFLATPVPLM